MFPDGVPGLSLSSGPAVAESAGGAGTAATGAFSFKPAQGGGTIDRLFPWLVIGAVVWALARR